MHTLQGAKSFPKPTLKLEATASQFLQTIYSTLIIVKMENLGKKYFQPCEFLERHTCFGLHVFSISCRPLNWWLRGRRLVIPLFEFCFFTLVGFVVGSINSFPAKLS